MCVCGRGMHVTVHMWSQRTTFQSQFFPPPSCGLRDWTEVNKLVWQVSLLTEPSCWPHIPILTLILLMSSKAYVFMAEDHTGLLENYVFPLPYVPQPFLYFIVFYGLDIYKEWNYIIWRMSLNLRCLSLWIRHSTDVKLTCISMGKSGLGSTWHGLSPVDDILFGPFYKAAFFDRFLLNFFLFYFSFCISQEICARRLWSCEHLVIQQLSP